MKKWPVAGIRWPVTKEGTKCLGFILLRKGKANFYLCTHKEAELYKIKSVGLPTLLIVNC